MQRTAEWVSMPPDFEPIRTLDDVAQKCRGMDDQEIPMDYMFKPPPPDADPELVDVSRTLLMALCKPWGDSPAVGTANSRNKPDTIALLHELEATRRKGTTIAWSGLSSQFEYIHPSATEDRWEAKIEGIGPGFRWDTTGLGVQMANAEQESMFLDSEQPNGWKSTEDVVVEDEDGGGTVTSDSTLSAGDDVKDVSVVGVVEIPDHEQVDGMGVAGYYCG